MAIIYTYPTISPSSDDLILLTDTSDSTKATKTATVASLLSIGLAQDINTTKVTLSSAQILALNPTGLVDLVAAPGAGKYIQILSCYASLNWNSIAYASVSTPYIVVGTSLDTLGFWGVFPNTMLLQTSDKHYQAQHYPAAQQASGAAPQFAINAPVQVWSWVGPWITGNSTLTIYTTYKIIDI